MRASGVFDGRRHLSQRPAFSSDIQIEGNGWLGLAPVGPQNPFGVWGLGVGGRRTRNLGPWAVGGAWVVGRGTGGGREVQPHISENKVFEHCQINYTVHNERMPRIRTQIHKYTNTQIVYIEPRSRPIHTHTPHSATTPRYRRASLHVPTSRRPASPTPDTNPNFGSIVA